jgi:hypothetical protein
MSLTELLGDGLPLGDDLGEGLLDGLLMGRRVRSACGIQKGNVLLRMSKA